MGEAILKQMAAMGKLRTDEEYAAIKKDALDRALIKFADRIAALRKSEGPRAVLPLTWMGGEYQWMSRAERRAKNVRRG